MCSSTVVRSVATALTLGLGVSHAFAAPLFEHGAVSVTATRMLDGAVVEEQSDIAPPGSPALASVLLHPLGILRFPTNPSALPSGFVSALMTGTGFGGVGLSFISAQRPDHAAIAQWTQEITNVGTSAGSLRAHFEIPRFEASIAAGPRYGPFPRFQMPLVTADAKLTATRFDEDGTQLSSKTMFDYRLTVERRFQGDLCPDIHDITLSDDLEARGPGTLRVIEEGDVCGIEVLPFSDTVDLPSLAPGELMLLEYTMIVENLAWRSFTPELGYQAFVGDPFDVSGGGGIRFSSPSAPAPVPEPASLALMLVAGIAALRLRAERFTGVAQPVARR